MFASWTRPSLESGGDTHASLTQIRPGRASTNRPNEIQMTESSSEDELHPNDQDILARYGVLEGNNKEKGGTVEEVIPPTIPHTSTSASAMDWEPVQSTESRVRLAANSSL
jgi:hypothetical protein